MRTTKGGGKGGGWSGWNSNNDPTSRTQGEGGAAAGQSEPTDEPQQRNNQQQLAHLQKVIKDLEQHSSDSSHVQAAIDEKKQQLEELKEKIQSSKPKSQVYQQLESQIKASETKLTAAKQKVQKAKEDEEKATKHRVLQQENVAKITAELEGLRAKEQSMASEDKHANDMQTDVAANISPEAALKVLRQHCGDEAFAGADQLVERRSQELKQKRQQEQAEAEEANRASKTQRVAGGNPPLATPPGQPNSGSAEHREKERSRSPRGDREQGRNEGLREYTAWKDSRPTGEEATEEALEKWAALEPKETQG